MTADEKIINELQELGAHFAYSKSKRHPSTEKYILGRKDVREIFDLEKTVEAMNKAKEVLKKALDTKQTVLFVGTKNEARAAVKEVAEKVNQPYMVNRFIGGTITNFPEIKKRINYLNDLEAKINAGNLAGYTKKEKLQLERELKKLQEKFGGIRNMQTIPSLLVVVDPEHEHIAVKEARDKNIPIIAIANNDCNYNLIDYVIPANDANAGVIKYILDYITNF